MTLLHDSALAAGAAVRTLQEFLSFLDWDHEAANDHLQRVVMDRHGCARAIGMLDSVHMPNRDA